MSTQAIESTLQAPASGFPAESSKPEKGKDAKARQAQLIQEALKERADARKEREEATKWRKERAEWEKAQPEEKQLFARVSELEAELQARAVPAREVELREAYRRGRADLQAEIVFAERLSAIQVKYPNFDAAWKSVKPLLPRVVWEEISDLEYGLEGAYQLSKDPELCAELAELPPEKARERFRFFVRDFMKLMKGALAL